MVAKKCRGEKTTPKGRFQNDLIMNFYISVHYSNEKQISLPSYRVLGSTSRNLSIINRTSDWLLKTETITSLCPCVTRYKLNLFCPRADILGSKRNSFSQWKIAVQLIAYLKSLEYLSTFLTARARYISYKSSTSL